MGDRYNFSLTTFSPTGKLGQIEYALNAVNQGVTCVGIKGTLGSNSTALTACIQVRMGPLL